MTDEQLAQSLIDAQGGTLQVLGEATERLNPDYIDVVEAARAQYATDDIEIDDKPMLSRSDCGCWVSAWVFVAQKESSDEAI